MMTYFRRTYFLLKGIPIVALLLYVALTFVAYAATEQGGSKFIWALPFGFGLLALIAGEPVRKHLGVTYKWLAAYTRSLGALYAVTAFALAVA